MIDPASFACVAAIVLCYLVSLAGLFFLGYRLGRKAGYRAGTRDRSAFYRHKEAQRSKILNGWN